MYQYPHDISSSLPLIALLNGSRLVLSLLTGNDIQEDIGQGVNLNGITEKSPFLSPLVWVGLLFLSDWEKEKKILQQMLLSPIDCNYMGMCGFNLFHFYLVQSLLSEDGFKKLQWWVDKPMVDCNISSLSLHDRPRILMLHPAQLVSKVASQVGNPKNTERILLYLLSRGMSHHYLDERWSYLAKTRVSNRHMTQRARKQRHHKPRSPLMGQFLPTPQMNDLETIPHDQHLSFTSATGLVFRFHGSYMDTIIKTHKFPFTMETIPPDVIQKWLTLFEKKWVPREEFTGSLSLCDDVFMGGDKLFIHLLNSWIYPIYPYSRIIMLTTFPLTERMYEYMCMKLRSGVFHLRPFHERCTTDWKDFFLWACYDCIHEFLFANQIEELVSQLEIFYSTGSFLEEYPDVETFILLNSHEMSAYQLYSREFDYTMCQVFHIFKKMSIFMKKNH